MWVRIVRGESRLEKFLNEFTCYTEAVVAGALTRRVVNSLSCNMYLT